jgi:hypothetical protein
MMGSAILLIMTVSHVEFATQDWFDASLLACLVELYPRKDITMISDC